MPSCFRSPKVAQNAPSVFRLLSLVFAALGCTTTTGTEGKIVATINLGTGFDTAAITGLVLILDAPGDAGLNLTATAAEQQSKGGHTYTSEVKDCDGDGRNELCVTFGENPFSAGSYQFTFSGTWPESVLLGLRAIVQMQGGKQETATKELFDDGTSLRFVARQSKAVTISIPCRVGYSCSTGNALTLTLTGTDPASPSNSTTPKAKGTADSTWTVKIYGDAACASTVLGQGTGADFAGAGIQATVAANATTTLYAQATDSSSNVSACVGPLSYTHDNLSPSAPSSLVLSPASPSNSNQPRLSGVAENGATVNIFGAASCDGGVVGTASASAFDAGYQLTVADNSTTTYSASATDPAGNTSGCSASVTYEEDSVAPANPVGTGVVPAGPANENSPVVSGTAYAASTVRVYKDPGCTASMVTGAVNDAGAFSVVVSVDDNTDASFAAVAVDPAGNATSCVSLGLAYIENSDPKVAFGAAAQSIWEGDGGVTVTVMLSSANPDGGTFVPYVVSGTATGPADHNLDAGTIAIPAGQTSATVTFSVVSDALNEANETVILTLDTPTNATLGAIATHTVTIYDDDPVPSIAWTAAAQGVIESAGTVTVTASLSAPSGLAVTAPYVVSGTAINPLDHNLDAGTITIPAGQTSANIAFALVSDTREEPNETVILDLGTPTNATTGAATQHTVTIFGDRAVRQVATGRDFTCALYGAGRVRCWGRGLYGRLGYGNTNNIGDNLGEFPSTAGDVDITDGGATVTQIAAGNEHTCALLSNGRVRCWGRGDSGQLGYGNYDFVGDDAGEFPSAVGDVDVTDGGAAVIQIAAGGAHTCALLSTGRVRCWGDNFSGQLGYGNTSSIGDNELPSSAGDVDVTDGGATVIQIAAGNASTCALLDGGKVRCWGNSYEGRLGYGNTNNIGDDAGEFPSTVGDVDVTDGGATVVQVAAGNQHTCALLSNGRVRCWGSSDFGQLGYGNTNQIGDNELPSSAGDVDVTDGGAAVTQLATGHYHTCAVLSNGRVRCWGRGGYGNLGYGNNINIGDNERPWTAGDVDVTDGGATVVQVSAGVYHTCAVLSNGRVRCWGSNGYGELGYGNQNSVGVNETPSSAGDVRVVARPTVVQVATGAQHTCALLSNGNVRCWGKGSSWQLGYGNGNSIGDGELPWTAGDIEIGTATATQVSAGSDHTCALLSNGRVRCWGYGGSGALGYGNTNNVGDGALPWTAGDVDVTDGGATVTQIAAGISYTCAVLSNGRIRCWGDGTYGRLGYGNTNNIGDNELPWTAGDVEVTDGGATVTQIDVSFIHTCAVLSNGRVRCWGRGDDGRLGYGNTSTIGDNELPWTAGDVEVTDGGATATQVAIGYYHSCALLSNGRVRCWGWNVYGQLGYGNGVLSKIGDNELPWTAGDVDVTDGGATATQIAAGSYHSCALLSNGRVRCWGTGSSGQLGYGNTNDIGDDERPWTAGDIDVTDGGAAVIQIAAGGAHTCALLDGGTVRCWGYGSSGELGYGNTNNIGDNELPWTAGDVQVVE